MLTKPNTRKVIIVIMLTLVWLIVGSAVAQNSLPPIRKKRLIESLKALRRGESQTAILKQIHLRGVDFELTPAVEEELRRAGGRPELIDAVQNSFRSDASTITLPRLSESDVPAPGVDRVDPIKLPNNARRFDQYGNIKYGDEKAHLDNFAIQLQQEANSTGYLIVYGKMIAE